ncbi:hypothetical protein HAX54_026695 [Datura stramonium]|uniref:BHLH domain-containing protein n=1 Tax=Datura stramonium TaxID=4076 RepID=A0ABS8V1L6_DATST|nr:hypothetical protein [Datura stramonium]
MAEEFEIGSGNWWESSSTSSSSTSTALSSMASNFGWPTNIVDIRNRSSLDSESVSQSLTDEGVRPDALSDFNLQIMGLGLNRDQTLFKGEKAVLLQENLSTNTNHWKQTDDYKGSFLHHQSVYSSNLESATYGSSPSNMIMQGVLASENHNNLSYHHPYNQTNYPQFLQSSPPNQQPSYSQLNFSNNTPFWNGAAAAMNDGRSSFSPSLPTQHASLTANEKPKVRKEKMGHRITALQQLVSPFGKTDTASVLSEVMEYIKFLHEQLTMLSKPYMKSGVSMQNFDKSNDLKQDLRSRGLCLVPVSSTFPVTNETTIDFWTPNSFGGTLTT